MTNLRVRSNQKELLDNLDIPIADIRQNMKELNTINTYLGGHLITIGGIKKILQLLPANQPITVCEIGCGGGDNLRAIEKWCTRHSIIVNFIGIDLKAACIEFAQQQYPDINAKWIVANYQDVKFTDNKPDIVFSSLFCHHFTEVSILNILHWMKTNTTRGFFINDLHRHWLAYHSIQIITRIFSSSYLVKNDAPLSVARGFKRKEWVKMIEASGILNCSIQWKWAFRHLIVYIAIPVGLSQKGDPPGIAAST